MPDSEMVDWLPVATVTAESGGVEFSEAVAEGLRFYRSVPAE